ncbi:MAG: 30S ribosomal protein S20 [Candidatus Latescibacteria bacterium]|nr:30S ribosomal protein S20 [Candidatus Latescibacterota bacterium]
MPNHKHFKKALKVNEKARLINHAAKSSVAKIIKKVKTAQSKEDAEKALITAVSMIDTTARKGIIKKETAARKKSRLSKFVAGMK